MPQNKKNIFGMTILERIQLDFSDRKQFEGLLWTFIAMQQGLSLSWMVHNTMKHREWHMTGKELPF